MCIYMYICVYILLSYITSAPHRTGFGECGGRSIPRAYALRLHQLNTGAHVLKVLCSY